MVLRSSGMWQESDDITYEAAYNGAILVDRSALGYLKFRGKSRLDLINRMSTQKVIDLKPYEGTATILTSDIGRIIDRLLLYEGEGEAFCVTGENNGTAIAGYLRRFVFYMDDFQVEDLGPETAILAVYGEESEPLLSGFLGEQTDIPLHHWRKIDMNGQPLALHRTDAIAGDGYFLICLAIDKQPIADALVTAGITPASDEIFEYLRIESGLPRFGHELTNDYIPLEANLWDDVSFNKGCYTGQEVIARMESRGRVAKRMVGLRGNHPLKIGQELLVGGKRAGIVTSTASGPVGHIALGFLKSAALEAMDELHPIVSAGDKTLEITAVY